MGAGCTEYLGVQDADTGHGVYPSWHVACLGTGTNILVCLVAIGYMVGTRHQVTLARRGDGQCMHALGIEQEAGGRAQGCTGCWGSGYVAGSHKYPQVPVPGETGDSVPRANLEHEPSAAAQDGKRRRSLGAAGGRRQAGGRRLGRRRGRGPTGRWGGEGAAQLQRAGGGRRLQA